MKTGFVRAVSANLAPLLCVTAFASSPALAGSADNLPPERVQGTVIYRSGGIGEDESRAMKEAAGQYPLQLEFVTRLIDDGGREAYVADVGVTISDRAGRQVLQAMSDGPFMLVRLPPGRYRITADYEQNRKEQYANVPAGGSVRAVFSW